MTYEEIESLLKKAGKNSTIERLRIAVGEEAKEITKMGDALRLDQAREYYAESIHEWLTGNAGLEPDPEQVLAHGARYMTSWAFAEIIRPIYARDILGDDDDEDDDDEPVGVPDSIVLRMCDANSQMGMALVEMIREARSTAAAAAALAALDRIREGLDAAEVDRMNELGNRKLESWERVEALLVELKELRRCRTEEQK